MESEGPKLTITEAHAAAKDQIFQELHELETQYLMPRFGSEEPYSSPSADDVLDIYGYRAADFNIESAYLQLCQSASKAIVVHAWVTLAGDPELHLHVMKLMRAVQESYSLLVAYSRRQSDHAQSTMTAEDMIVRFAAGNDDKKPAIVTVFRYILANCYRLKLSHQGYTVFKEIYTAAGVATSAWEPARDYAKRDVSTLELLVAHICTSQQNQSVYELFLSIPTKALTSKLEICLEPEFPVLQRSREYIAFSDGIYHVNTDKFILHSNSAGTMPQGVVACKYHDSPFAPVMADVQTDFSIKTFKAALHAIPTPKLDELLNTQQFDDETQFWLLVILGRALYFLKQFDDWEIAGFFRGLAGTGMCNCFLSIIVISRHTLTDSYHLLCCSNRENYTARGYGECL
jgi:hypothetical protein